MVICFSRPILYPGEKNIALFSVLYVFTFRALGYIQGRISTDLNTSRIQFCQTKYCYCSIILSCCLEIVANFKKSVAEVL